MLHCCQTPKRKRLQSSVVLMEGSGWGALCKSWCTYACTCTHINTHKQHGSDTSEAGKREREKQTVKQRPQCKIIPEKDQIVKWKSEQRQSGRQKRDSNRRYTEGRDRKPRSVADYDKAMSLIFCPSCRDSQEQLQWQGSVPLLHSQSRSIINGTENQGRSCRACWPAHAGATGGGGEGGGIHWGKWLEKERRGHVVGFISTPVHA